MSLHWFDRFADSVVGLLNRLLHHPDYPSIAVFARLIVNLASFLWGLAVTANNGDISRTPYPWMAQLWPMSLFAALLMTLATAQLVCLLGALKPRRWLFTGYGAMFLWWLFNFWVVTLGGYAPGAFSSLFALTLVALFAWLSGTRHADPDAAGAH